MRARRCARSGTCWPITKNVAGRRRAASASSTPAVPSPGPSSNVSATWRRKREPRSTGRPLRLKDCPFLVELEHAHRALGRGLDAQPAEHALVEVSLDDFERPLVACRVDVDWADLGQLGR